MKDSGITLIELIIVISIIGILVIALGFDFAGWQGGYKVEKTIKEIYADLMDARARAMQFNREYFINLTATTYSMIEDTNDNYVMDDAAVATFPKTVEYTIIYTGVAPIVFDKRGLISNTGTLSLTHTATPDYDCVRILQTQINLGWMTGGGCREK